MVGAEEALLLLADAAVELDFMVDVDDNVADRGFEVVDAADERLTGVLLSVHLLKKSMMRGVALK